MAQNNQQNNQNNQQNNQNNQNTVISEEEKAKIIADFLAQQMPQQQMMTVPQQAQVVANQPKVIDLKAGAKNVFMWVGIGTVAVLTMGAGVMIIKAVTEKNNNDLANAVVVDNVTNI